ncbi:MAG TPA: helix-turn-helix domain-containing protein [Actinomycetales bacterium]|nr:helix-turn-helix domain-containing protein [Actinomycetales bacterium]
MSSSRHTSTSRPSRRRHRETPSASSAGAGAADRTTRAHTAESRLLDAARECILAVGWRRTTLTDVARRGGVSRMTIYRIWPDMQTLLADLMTREWSGLADAAARRAAAQPTGAARVAAGVVATVTALRENELLRRILEVDPEMLLPYLLDRRGRSQDGVLALLEPVIVAGQDDGTVRRGDPTLLARSIVLAAHGFALSAQTMTDGISEQQLQRELHTLVERYVTP